MRNMRALVSERGDGVGLCVHDGPPDLPRDLHDAAASHPRSSRPRTEARRRATGADYHMRFDGLFPDHPATRARSALQRIDDGLDITRV